MSHPTVPRTHLALAAAATALFFPLGIPAVLCATTVVPASLQGAAERAQRSSQRALLLGTLGVVLGVVLWVFLTLHWSLSRSDLYDPLAGARPPGRDSSFEARGDKSFGPGSYVGVTEQDQLTMEGSLYTDGGAIDGSAGIKLRMYFPADSTQRSENSYYLQLQAPRGEPLQANHLYADAIRAQDAYISPGVEFSANDYSSYDVNGEFMLTRLEVEGTTLERAEGYAVLRTYHAAPVELRFRYVAH